MPIFIANPDEGQDLSLKVFSGNVEKIYEPLPCDNDIEQIYEVERDNRTCHCN